MADGRLTEDGASQSITDAISSLYNRASGGTQNTVRAIGGFLRTAQEQVTAVVQSDVAQDMAQKVGDGLGTARERILEMDRAGRERFAEYFPQAQLELPPKATGQEIPIIESTPGETLKSMAQAAIPKVQQAAEFAFPKVQEAGEFLAQGASTLAGNLQATWREMATQAITPETLKPQMEQVPVTIRVDGANAFQGTLTGGQLLGLDQKQNAMIQQALTNPKTVDGSVKMLVGNQPQLVLSQKQVLTDNFNLTGPQQTAEINMAPSPEQTSVPPTQTVVTPTQAETQSAVQPTPIEAGVSKQSAAQPASVKASEVQPVKMPENWQEALFAQVSAISTGMDQIHQKISQLETQLGAHSTEFGYIADEHNALGQKIDNLADQLQDRGSALKPARPTVRQWLNTTRTTIKTAVVAKLQQFKQFVTAKYQQHLGGKVEQATDFVKDTAQVVGDNARAAEAKIKAVPYQATQTFMAKAGEPAIRFLLSKTGKPDQGGNLTLDTPSYQYSMDAKGNVAMTAKDGRGTLKPNTMTQKDLKAVGAISKHFQAHQQQQRQQQLQAAAPSKTALKR